MDRLRPADELGHRCGEVGAGPLGGRRFADHGAVLSQDRLVQLGELAARVEAELLGESPAQVGEAVERLTRPSGPVQGADVQRAQPFPQRVPGDEVAQLAREQAVVAEREPRLRRVLLRGEPLVLQPPSLRRGERLVGDVGQCGPPPERERIGQEGGPNARLRHVARLRDERPEPVRVDGVRLDLQLVARPPPGHQRAPAGSGGGQGATQLRDLRLQGVGRVAGEPLAPQVRGQPVGRHGAPLVHEEVGQQRADLRLGHAHRAAVGVPQRERTQHPETHVVTVAGGTDSGPCADPQETVRAGAHRGPRQRTTRGTQR